MRSNDNWKLKSSVILVSLIFTLGLLEIGLRIVNFPRIEATQRQLFLQHDATLGWKNTPGANGYLTMDEYSVHLQYNARGLRGPLKSYDKPDGTYRIVVLGDSFVDGYSVATEDRLTEQLEQLLPAQLNQPVEVIPMGTAGYSTDQELLWLESEGYKYQPDLVVLLFYDNDVWFNASSNYWRGGKPLFNLNAGRLILTNVPVPEVRFNQNMGRTSVFNRTKEWLKGFRLMLLARQGLHNTPWLHSLAIKAGIVGPPPNQVLVEENSVYLPDEFLVYKTHPGPRIISGWQITEALIKKMKTDAELKGSDLVVFHVPFTASVYEHQWNNMRKDYGFADDEWDIDEVSNNLLEICDRAQLQCIEPTSHFRQVAELLDQNNKRLYYVKDAHWNANGHRLAAEILAEYIVLNK